MYFGSGTLLVHNPPSLLDHRRALIHCSTPELFRVLSSGQRLADIADCGNPEALIGATSNLSEWEVDGGRLGIYAETGRAVAAPAPSTMPTAGIISPALAHDPVDELLIYFLIGSCAQRRLAEEDICDVSRRRRSSASRMRCPRSAVPRPRAARASDNLARDFARSPDRDQGRQTATSKSSRMRGDGCLISLKLHRRQV